MSSKLIDERWKSIVRPLFNDRVQVLDPDSLLDPLYSDELVTEEEYDRLRSMPSRQEKSRMLLKEILPRRGPASYDQFVKIARKTEGQEHVVKVLERETGSSATGEEGKNELEKKLAEFARKLAEWKKKHEESEKKRAESEKKRAESEKKNPKSELTNIGLRNKIGRWDGGHLKWKQFEPNMPIDCVPFGCVAEINVMIHVGSAKRMFQLKEGGWNWKGEKHDLRFCIGSVFECEGKGYVMEGGGPTKEQCKRIYEWKSESRDLELLTEIPHEYQKTFFSKTLRETENERVARALREQEKRLSVREEKKRDRWRFQEDKEKKWIDSLTYTDLLLLCLLASPRPSYVQRLRVPP